MMKTADPVNLLKCTEPAPLGSQRERECFRPMESKRMFLGIIVLILVVAGAVYFWPGGKEPVSGPLGELPVFMDFMTPT